MKQYIMALDQGTTSSRCILFDSAGTMLSMAQKEYSQMYPKQGWVEHDPKEIWSSQLGVAAEALGRAGITAKEIAAIGITNQRETTIVWDKRSGEPVYPAIVWQCRRTAAMIDALKAEGLDRVIREKTGLIADAYFSATKIAWILDHVPGARQKAEQGHLLFGTVDTWLIWKLTKGKVFATDYTNASRTMLYNIHTLCWDQELLDYWKIPNSMLPEVKESSGLFGVTDSTVFGAEIPITGVAGDQQAALFGQCCFESGEAKNTYGTGCFLLMNTGTQAVSSQNGLLTTIAVGIDGKIEYALEGSVFVAGAVVQWLRDELELIRYAAETERLAEEVKDTNGMYLVPAFTGLGAPYWDAYARGTIVGLTRGVKKAHFVRAALESLAYQTYDVLKAMESDAGMELKTLRVDGGASANRFLLQFQADVLQVQVQRPQIIETTALGAAYLAGLSVGYWKDKQEIRENWAVSQKFEPKLSGKEMERRLYGWHKAVRCAKGWEERE
ncbi:MAG: glycerol kinase GlpK [Lachnospiraceae bacterium]|nr:glycerol kinase GlpK [Lachnospiraceae bacterium]